ncbi:MAG: hypothetical protein G01um101418_751 [Parcubacteria group bacterium Gr01-1014_18]|nr:MAG: hypothetical protein Greene041636_741 [Parcubacteria group bacterium Greene0416_36]TSC80243.1 MAG: hypothetical protein G01um101418_751 [Parcubacteria group bacterium Gr01-1014_18]TSC98425.1 MAG: hypothetical protein Greene101420_778 [Parcubacteria group bacterium Greene1014_20]TSD06966.1 MAG: hypothetical protein Greene07142_529 [Parcubacteria group bacterium Greene0714_2]
MAELKKEWEASGGDSRFDVFDVAVFNWDRLRSMVSGSALFGKKRLVILREPSAFFSPEDMENFEAALPLFRISLNSLVVVESEKKAVPRAKKSTKDTSSESKRKKKEVNLEDLFSLAEKKEWSLPPGGMASWIRARFAQHHIEADENAVRLIAMASGEDLFRAASEVDKLMAYAGGMGAKGVTGEMASSLIFVEPEWNVFALLDALAKKNKDLAVRIFEDMKEKTENVATIGLLANHVRQLSIVKSAMEEGTLSEVKLHPFVVSKLREQAALFSWDRIRALVESLLNLDRRIKRGGESVDTLLVLWILFF